MRKLNNAILQEIDGINVMKVNVDGIPVIYIEPSSQILERKLVIFLNGLGGTKELLITYLKDIADKGYIALAFDNYQHGERSDEDEMELAMRVFSNMQRYGWAILGQTVLDTERIIDWAIENLNIIPEIYMGGISMGGDISIAAAGIDSRIRKIVPIVATPDWLRPGMHDIIEPDELMDPGRPDAYSQFFYDQFNPITHLNRYIDGPCMRVTLGEEDSHIPPENMERFKNELKKLSPKSADKIQIVYLKGPNANHGDVINRKDEWWPDLLDWWL